MWKSTDNMNAMCHICYKCQPETYLWCAEKLMANNISWWLGWPISSKKNLSALFTAGFAIHPKGSQVKKNKKSEGPWADWQDKEGRRKNEKTDGKHSFSSEGGAGSQAHIKETNGKAAETHNSDTIASKVRRFSEVPSSGSVGWKCQSLDCSYTETT